MSARDCLIQGKQHAGKKALLNRMNERIKSDEYIKAMQG